MKSNQGLVEYVKNKLGCYYWYGTFGQIASKALYQAKKNQYPAYYTANNYQKQIGDPKQVFDCVGLVKGYLWCENINSKPVYKASQDIGANAMFNRSKNKGDISSMPDIPGILVYKGTKSKKSHVGVYIGSGKVVEAKGHAYGVITSNISDGWLFWGECPFITYDIDGVISDLPSINLYKVKTNTGVILRLRSEPNTNSKVIAKMPQGSIITVLDTVNDWARVKYNGIEGWAYTKYMVKC